jgi:hypothetical protein
MLKIRSSIICFLIIFLGLESEAQVRLGIKGNVSLSFNRQQQILYDDYNDFLLYRLTVLEQDVSPGFGIMAYMKNDLLFFQPEIMYNQIATNFRLESFIEDSPTEALIKKKTSFINIPIKAGLWIDKFKLGVGPVVSIIISDTDATLQDDRFEEQRRNVEMGFTFNFGVIVDWLHFDLSYESRFNGIAEYFYFRDARAGFRGQPGYLHVGIAIVFPEFF